MGKITAPVVLIEDDPDDQEFIKEAFRNLNLPNELLCFFDGKSFIDYLSNTEESPFVILCNLNMQGMNGFEIRQKIADTPELKRKSIPFIFLTTDTRPSSIFKAYDAIVQGYVIKGDTYAKLERSLRLIMDYWTLCCHPGHESPSL